MVDLSVRIGKSTFKNPVFTASGTFGYGLEFSGFLNVSALGAISVKGLSLNPVEGNPGPRIIETPSGMLNAIGLQNVGVREFVKTILPVLVKKKTCVIANIYGKTVDEYGEIAEVLDDADGVEALELNISCPNVQEGGILFGQDPRMASSVVRRVRESTGKTLIVKLSPNVSDIVAIARAVEDSGADALSLINTLLGMAVDLDNRKPVLKSVMGGLSGPAVKPVALRMVHQVFAHIAIPIIGVGGIMDCRDALEFIVTGATAVQVGTANFINPSASIEILEGIKSYFEKNGITRIEELRGTLNTGM